MQRLYWFLADKDEGAARRAVRVIRGGVKILTRQPHVGRPIEDLDPECREWLIEFGAGGYVVVYRFDGATTAILAVRH